MNKILFLFLLSLLIFKYSASQNPCDAFNSTEVTFYGLDFTFTRLIGPGFENPMNIKDKYFVSWNELFIKESSKYDLKKFFLKSSVLYNFGIVTERNDKVDYSKLVTLNSSDTVDVTLDTIQHELNGYKTNTDKGVGLVFFIQTFNKYTESAGVSVVFFDIATKNILAVKRMSGKPAGAGLRNYWAGALYKILLSGKEKYSKWKKEYCK
jgi:hypothetical protein